MAGTFIIKERINPEMKLMNAYGQEITDLNQLELDIFEYVGFDEAAVMINPRWTRHHLHKELEYNRIFRSELLVAYNPSLYATKTKSFNHGKKYFITKREVERLRNEVKARPIRKIRRCRYCGKAVWWCEKKPCDWRRKQRPEYKQSIEAVADIFDRFFQRSLKPSKQSPLLRRKTAGKGLQNPKKRDNGEDNAVDG